MIKLKMLVSFAVVLGALMVTAAPALAEYQAIPSKGVATSGTTNTIAAGEFLATNSKGEEVVGSITCPAAGITSEWKIRSTGKLSEETKGPNQQPTKRGPHQQYHVKWESTTNGCTALAHPADVAPCILQTHQQRGVLNSVPADVVTDCFIKIPFANCTITIAAANEATGENFQLLKTDFENKAGTNNLLKAEVTGITQKVTGAGCPLVSNNHGSLKGLELESVNEILV